MLGDSRIASGTGKEFAGTVCSGTDETLARTPIWNRQGIGWGGWLRKGLRNIRDVDWDP